LHANDCRVLVETVYGDLPKNEQKELYEELNKAVKEERAETHMKMQEEICELQLRSLQ
jgi:polyhydroxyalkanoate synthesis regulator phasin